MLNPESPGRQSNIEMVRIIAMSMIVIWHDIIHGGPFTTSIGYHATVPFLIYGVNLFVLISGYFLIRARWETVIRLVLYVYLINIALYLLGLVFGMDLPLSSPSVRRYFLAPLSNPRLWFLNVYFGLILVSPLLNIAISRLSLHNIRIIIAALSFCEFYSCFAMDGYMDQAGYNLYHFIYLYLLAWYLRVEPAVKCITTRKMLLVTGVFLVAELVLCGWGYLSHNVDMHFWLDHYMYKYTNPVTVLVSVVIVLWFIRHPFQSKTVNFIASASLGVYLVNDGIVSEYFYSWLRDAYLAPPVTFIDWTYCVRVAITFAANWTIAIILTMLFRPLVLRITHYIGSHIPSWARLDFDSNPEINH